MRFLLHSNLRLNIRRTFLHSQLRNVANRDFWHATNEHFTVPRMHRNSATHSQLLVLGNTQIKKLHRMLEIGMGESQWLMR